MPVPVLLRQDNHHEPRDLTPSHGTCCGQTDKAMKTASDQQKTNVQHLGEKMALDHGFLGVPTQTFDEGGRRQFAELLREGLSPETSVLEIGCGCLRTAYWLIPFLGEQNYCGIEPHRDRVRWGLDLLFDDQVLRQRQPRFDHNAEFDLSVFGKKFDMVLAGSIWTHCSKSHIRTMLEGFLQNSNENAVFLVSYLPARSPEEDYNGTAWVGTSHVSDEPGIVRHSKSWIDTECTSLGLRVDFLDRKAFDGQLWLRVQRASSIGFPGRLQD
ncbi:hypothetical protein FIU93_11855 [Labrenzia sp. THAF35]|nr:hypothetical protein FIU93_11855 [Labrenzia sp. THAF35]